MAIIYHHSFLLICVVLLLFTNKLTAQITADSLQAHQALESFLESIEGEQTIDEELLADLLHLLENPISINTVSTTDLTRIPFLEYELARAIISFRDKHGQFDGLSDLSNVPELDTQVLYTLSPFISFESSSTDTQKKLSDRRGAYKHTFVQSFGQKLDLPAGYSKSFETGGFRGSPSALYSRLTVQWRDRIALRLTMEKDPGESFSRPGSASKAQFDHATGSVHLRGKRWFKEVIIGDFAIMIGQGLMLWRNTGRGKGTAPVLDPVRTGAGFKPIASREENAFFRGGVISLRPLKQLTLTTFYSNRTQDANLKQDTEEAGTPFSHRTEPFVFVSSLHKSGLHRTEAELSRKDAFTEQLMGVHGIFQTPLGEIGVAGYQSSYNIPFNHDDQPYKYFNLTGAVLQGLSLHGKIRHGGLSAFGEVALSSPGGYAMTSGLRFFSPPAFQSVLLWRRFQKNYIALHSNAFSEFRSTVHNEEGFYLAFQFDWSKVWRVSFFADVYRHPWLRSSTPSPSSGIELFGSLRYQPRKWLIASLMYRNDRGKVAFSRPSLFVWPTQTNEIGEKQSLRLQLDYLFSNRFKLRSRVELKKYKSTFEGASGAYSMQDVVWTPSKKTYLHVRFSLFNIEDSKVTLYAYENDLRYRFSIYTFSGVGARNFILLRQRLGTQLTLEVKYGTTRYGKQTDKGAGADFYSGTLVREINTQIIWHI